jgi:hypothetical protein
MNINFADPEMLENVFEHVADVWGLSASEREAVRGAAVLVSPSSGGRLSEFLRDRMTLIIEINYLLSGRMDAPEIRQWIRKEVAGGAAPLESMVGSTDRMRRLRALLALEVRQ